jgi:S-methylmethionine-dependent homocysteine/selenocysteine methylase
MNASKNMQAPLLDGIYLTDGGLETTLVFHYGIELAHFASFELVNRPEGREALRRYFRPYLDLAREFGLNFVLDTPTWRANPDWAYKLGYSDTELREINRHAVRFIRGLRNSSVGRDMSIVLNGEIGPRGDGYCVEKTMTPEDAEEYHLPQVRALADEGVDMVTALTLNYSDEAIGIVRAAQASGIPVAISFTVETDGRLPSGESLKEAIEKTDWLTGRGASYFMINCAHPTHFLDVLRGAGEWTLRIGGVRANASCKSHAELEACETLDMGDRKTLAAGYVELMNLLPRLRVFGGCCGTDHRHLAEICDALSRDKTGAAA